jgi:hypothetical protein
MASEAQVLANRSNAEKSTGPRTPEGKAAVSQNAVRHGLLAREVVIKGEDLGQFEFYRDQMLGELAPVGSVESMLAERVVSLSWRLQRAERLQGAAFDSLYEKETAEPLVKLPVLLRPKGAGRTQGDPGDGNLVLGQVVVADFSHAKVLDRLLMYERRIEHSLYRTMGELQRQRLLRELDPPVEAVSAVCRGPATGERLSGKLGAGSHSPEEVGRGRPTHEEVPYGVTTSAPDAAGQSCETKPIAAGASEGQVPCGKEVMNDSPQDDLGKTNPISEDEGDAGWLSPPPDDADHTPCRELSGNALFRPPTIVYS